MRKVLLTTNHPAPYIDKWLYAIEKKYKLTVIYNHLKDNKKTWSEFSGYPGLCYESLSINKLLGLVKCNDLLIVGGWTNKACFLTIILGKLLGKKVGIFTDYPFHQNKYADMFKRIFLYRWIDYIFCATKSTCTFVQNKYNLPSKKIKFFPYAIDFPNKEINIYPKRNNDKIQILIANNFIPRKGYETLFAALEIIAKDKKSNNFKFHIAGHGELLKKYQKQATCLDLDITFYGWCELEVYNNLQNTTEVYIHASLEEPFGIPPLDAMARGKVVIVSDGVKSTESLIKNGINGYIYEANNAQELSDIILNLNEKEFRLIGNQAKIDVLENYNIEKNLESIESCFIK